MKLFFAGSETPLFHDILKQQGADYCLKSAWSLGYKKNPRQSDFKQMIIDSGGYTARVKGINIPVQQYIDYINRYNVKLAFNLDTSDPTQTEKNLNQLRAQTKAKIIDIYHYSDYCDSSLRDKVLQRAMSDNDALMAVGGVAGVNTNRDVLTSFLDYVFSHTRGDVRVHGLGMTNAPMLQRYPYYSVDSTAWLSPGKYGSTKRLKDKRAIIVNAKVTPYAIRLAKEAQHFIKLQHQVTDLWRKRGVDWS
jgi:hypothetical protein